MNEQNSCNSAGRGWVKRGSTKPESTSGATKSESRRCERCESKAIKTERFCFQHRANYIAEMVNNGYIKPLDEENDAEFAEHIGKLILVGTELND